MTKTKCNKCGAIENTKASVGSRCIFCEIGIMRKIEEVTHPFVLLGIILILAACAPLQDNFPVPKESSPTTEQPVQPVNDTANVTNIPPPPKEILLPADGLGVYLLDADSKGTSIITLNGKSLLINPNQDTIRTLKIVKNLGIANLDYLILTNSDDNNIAGAAPIILRAKPLEIIHSGIPSTSLYYRQYLDLFYPKNATIVPFDTKIKFGDSTVDIIVPYDDGQPMASDSSMVIKLSYGNFNILFTSDCAVDCESRISNVKTSYLVSNGGCDSLSLFFLKETDPKQITFMGTPCDETLKRVESLAIPHLITSKDGDVVITSDGISDGLESSKTK